MKFGPFLMLAGKCLGCLAHGWLRFLASGSWPNGQDNPGFKSEHGICLARGGITPCSHQKSLDWTLRNFCVTKRQASLAKWLNEQQLCLGGKEHTYNLLKAGTKGQF